MRWSCFGSSGACSVRRRESMRMVLSPTAMRARCPAPVPGDGGLRRGEYARTCGACATSRRASGESPCLREALPTGEICGRRRRLEPLANRRTARPASLTSCLPWPYWRIAPMAVRMAAAVGAPLRGHCLRSGQSGRGASNAMAWSSHRGCVARASARSWATVGIAHSSRRYGSMRPRRCGASS
jgi:hypothetical protein